MTGEQLGPPHVSSGWPLTAAQAEESQQRCDTQGQHGVLSVGALYVWTSHILVVNLFKSKKEVLDVLLKNHTFFFLFTQLGLEFWGIHVNFPNSLHRCPRPAPPPLTECRRLPLPGLHQALIIFNGDERDVSGNQERKTSQRSFMIQ